MATPNLRESDFQGYNSKNSEQQGSDNKVKFLQSPQLFVTKPDNSRDVSPVQMTQSYFQDSDSKSQNGYSISKTTITTKIVSNTRPNYLQSTGSTNNLTQIGQTSTQTRNFSTDFKPKNTENLTLNTPSYASKPMTIQDMNNSQLESARNKHLKDIENSLIKERALVNALNVEKEVINNKLKESEPRFSPFSSQTNAFGTISNHSVQLNKDEVSRLYILCKEKDQIIQGLMDDLASKPSREAAEAEKMHLITQISNYKNTVIEFENKIALLSTENERLNRKIQDRDYEIQKKNSESAFNEEKLKIEMEELIQSYEERLNKLIMENEKIIMINESLRSKLDQAQQSFEIREKQIEEQTEKIRNYWKDHFSKELQEHKKTVEMEKGVYESQLKHTKTMNVDMENKMKQYLLEIQELNQAIIEKDSLLQEFQIQLGVFDKKQQELTELSRLYADANKRIKDIEGKLNVVLNENQKLADVADSNRIELEQWKQRYFESEERQQKIQQDHTKQILDLRISFDEQKEQIMKTEKANLDAHNQINQDEKVNLLMKIVLVQAENEKSHNQIIQLQRVIDDLQFEIKQQLQKLEFLNSDQSMLMERNEDLEKKIESLIHNIDELNQGLKIRIEEVEIWRQKYIELQNECEDKINQLSSHHEQHTTIQIEKFTKEIENQKQEYEEHIKKSKKQQQAENDDRQRQIAILEKKIDNIKQENDSQSNLLIEKIRQNEDLQLELHQAKIERERVHTAKLEKESEYESLKLKYDRLELQHKQQFEDFISKLRAKDDELDEMRRDRSNKNIEIESLKAKMQLIDEEIEKRKAVYNDLQLKFNQIIDENERLLNKVSELEMLKKDIERLKVQHIEEIETVKFNNRENADKEKREMQIDFRQKIEKEITDQRQHYDGLMHKLESNITVLENKLKIANGDYEASEAKRLLQIEQFNQKINEMEAIHKVNLEDQRHLMEREFETQFNNHSIQLKTIIADHEREITSLKGQVENLIADLNIERSKYHRAMIDLDKACRDIEIWRGKAGQIDPNHPYLQELQSQLEIKRRECLDLQGRLHDIDRRRNDLERQLTKTRARAPSVDGFGKPPIITLERSTVNLGILEENDKLNRMVLNRCREIVHNKY
ncbi:hypothetical protein ABPG74_007389 [Tetrahymena malaccensis]